MSGMRKLTYSLMISTVVLGLGCAKEEVLAPVVVATPLERLSGNWQSTCVKATEFGITETTAFELGEEEATFTRTISREGDCSLADVKIIQVSKYRSEEDKFDEAGLAEMRLSPKSIRILPVSAAGVSMLRFRETCGIKDWIVGLERDVTEIAKKVTRESNSTKKKDFYHNCVLVSGPATAFSFEDEKLYFAKSDRKAGPMSLDQVRYFVKRDLPIEASAPTNP